jgi:hypothetical protein
MSVVMQLLDHPGGLVYLRDFDPDYADGRGHVSVTRDIAFARRFDSMIEAMEEWKRPSNVHPIRETDGKPNRPLSAYTVQCVKVEE